MQALSFAVAVAVSFAELTVAKTCSNAIIPVHLTARQGNFDIMVPQTNLQVTDFILNLVQQGRNYTETALAGYNTTSGTYNISAQFCQPTGANSPNPVVQVLTHGIGFDKTYWDLAYNDFNYSYVDVATDHYKYYTLSYDRLGIGSSSHGEPLNEIQAFLEIAALYKLTQILRQGTYPGVSHAFDKVVHVGHSFGSAQTYAMVNMYPKASDGIVLTGFSMNASFAGLFLTGASFVEAKLNQPLRFGSVNYSALGSQLDMYLQPFIDFISPLDLSVLPAGQDLPNGYIIPANLEANKLLFFKPGFYDDGVLKVAEMTKQPVTLGELLTLGSAPMINQYAGPVMVITGDSDLPYCGGNCLATGNPALASIPAAVAKSFPNVPASNFTAYIQRNTGHGINLHYNSTGAYNVIQGFLASMGLVTT